MKQASPASAGSGTRRVIMSAPRPARPPLPATSPIAWRLFGWFGLVLAVVGFTDILLAAYPFRPGNPDWEYGAIHQTIAMMPLPTIGLAALLASAFAQGTRWLAQATAILLLLMALALLVTGAVFLTVLPLVLEAAPPPVLPGVKKAALRTVLGGAAFPIAYLVGGVAALRYSMRRDTDG